MADVLPPRKRRRTRISTAPEETVSRQVHPDFNKGAPSINFPGGTGITSDRSTSFVANGKAEGHSASFTGERVAEYAHAPAQELPKSQATMKQGLRGSNAQCDAFGYSNASSNITPNLTSLMQNLADPTLHLRIQSLPILENLSAQLLDTLARGSYQEALGIVSGLHSGPGQVYAGLKTIFDDTKKLYSTDNSFLIASDLNLQTPEYSNVLRKANLATFVSSVFSGRDAGFYYLNRYFLEIFVPDGGRLLKSQGALYLHLKTHAYIAAMSIKERSQHEILEELFPSDLEQRLISRRTGGRLLTPTEIDFVKRARSRRDHLLNEADDDASLAALPDKYQWEDFLRDLITYVSKNFDDLVAGSGLRFNRNRFLTYHASAPIPQAVNEPVVASLEHTEHSVDDAHVRTILQAYNQEVEAQRKLSNQGAECMEHAIEGGLQNNLHPDTTCDATQPNEDHDQGQIRGEQKHFGETETSDVSKSWDAAGDIPYPTQSAPTQVLYERARIAATAKASPNSRRGGLPSHRRPWTTEEENALMAGLDRVKGPHWSQILAMFGAGGTINESLKDRNQVQLKDKARNLKLFFLKSGIEVPYYLQFVTGELKTRAPAQAAKNEAKERERQQGDEDKAHVEGILALVGGGHGAMEGTEGGGDGDVGEGEGEGGDGDGDGDGDEDQGNYEHQLVAQLQAAHALPHEGTGQGPAIAVGHGGEG